MTQRPRLPDAQGHPTLEKVENHYRFQVVIHDRDEPTLRAQVEPFNVPGFSEDFSIALHAFWAERKAQEQARGAFSVQSQALNVREQDVRFRVIEAMHAHAQAGPDAIRAWRDAMVVNTGADVAAALVLLSGMGEDVSELQAKAAQLWPLDFA